MELIIKAVVAALFIGGGIYRCRWTWPDLRDFYQVRGHLIPGLKKIDEFYRLVNWPKVILIIWSAYIFFFKPLYPTAVLIGVVLFFIGLVVAISARYSLGRSWADFCEVTDTREPLVTTGLYSWCRNPIYLGLGIEWIGFVITFGWHATAEFLYIAVVAIVATGSIGAFHRVVLEEEKILAERFGKDYSNYCETTPRYLPIPGKILKIFKKESIL